jgi:hypothetical protein
MSYYGEEELLLLAPDRELCTPSTLIAYIKQSAVPFNAQYCVLFFY